MSGPRTRLMGGYLWTCECPGRWATTINGHSVVLSSRSDGWHYQGPVSSASGGRVAAKLPDAARTAVRWAEAAHVAIGEPPPGANVRAARDGRVYATGTLVEVYDCAAGRMARIDEHVVSGPAHLPTMAHRARRRRQRDPAMTALTKPQVRLLAYLDRCEHASQRQCAESLYGTKAMVGAVDNIARALLARDGPALIRSYSTTGRSWSAAITPAGRRALREHPDGQELR